MCSLCGALGGKGHWTDTATTPEAFGGGIPMTRQRERQQRVALVNKVLRHYRLSVEDWEGASYLLRNRTGRTEIVDSLSSLWAMAEEITRGECDPLDPGLLAALATESSP